MIKMFNMVTESRLKAIRARCTFCNSLLTFDECGSIECRKCFEEYRKAGDYERMAEWYRNIDFAETWILDGDKIEMNLSGKELQRERGKYGR